MKAALLLLPALALLQAMPSAESPTAEPRHLRYERQISVPQGKGGTVCALLDAQTYAHARSRSAEDLRVYTRKGEREVEVPFVLTENAAAAVETESITPQNAGLQDGRLVFDLPMPQRPYSEVDLGLQMKDFVAVAEVTAPQPGASAVHLGTLTLFDLSHQHGSRSTALTLQESTFARLHVALRFARPDGTLFTPSPGVLTAATVPASREAQVLYTPVASSSAITLAGRNNVARIEVPANVPVERVEVQLDPAFKANFVRSVRMELTAHAPQDGRVAQPNVAEYEGEISRENLQPLHLAGAPPIHVEHLGFEALTIENQGHPATAEVFIANGDDQPLPLRAVVLEMRQRRICFDAQASAAYTLRYGDEALHAPVYDYARLFNGAAPAVEATLGPETANPGFTPRADTRPFTERHPELLWIVLLGVIAVLGATAIGSVKHQRRTQ